MFRIIFVSLALSMTACAPAGPSYDRALAQLIPAVDYDYVDFITPKYHLSVRVQSSVFERGLQLNDGHFASHVTVFDPDVIALTITEMVDTTVAYWLASRSDWNARLDVIADLDVLVVDGCYMPCLDDLCFGATDSKTVAAVSLYNFVSDMDMPESWSDGTALYPIRREALKAEIGRLAGFFQTNSANYFSCRMREGQFGLGTLAHEFDHSLDGIDPHNRDDQEAVRSTGVVIESFTDGNLYVGHPAGAG